ncbi:crossover junction endonuclease eme1 [Plakobranchus ocellatus]|uniref:Crossover junction endonuclease eme1 n=1 Tax=Plakobranchus ocellatus TaxID=259542 RepID=A0AAV3XY21_9GAST|nr:crossover junction endonuclease eme1 [Plakobranchus ocellatus]
MAGLTVFIDPAVAPEERQKELIKKYLSEINTKCEFVPQRIEKSLSWQTSVSASKNEHDDITKETMVVLHAADAVSMVNAYLQRKQTGASEQLTLTEWIQSMQSAAPTQNLTVLVVGLAKYFSGQKRSFKQKYREAVTGQPVKARKRKGQAGDELQVKHEEVEEAFVEAQLFTGCFLQPVDSDEELANQIKMFTKAVVEKPSKKDRLNNVFSFLEEGTGGLRVSKDGEGLRKVWKHQLMQFKNLGPEMAEAICSVYPSPSLLHQVILFVN